MHLTSRRTLGITSSHLPFTFHLLLILSSTSVAATHSYVLVDYPSQQLYPLFGFLPYPASILHQALLGTLLLLSLIAVSLLHHTLLELISEVANMVIAVGLAPASLFSHFSSAGPSQPLPSSSSHSSSNYCSSSTLRRRAPKSTPSTSQAKSQGDHYAGLANTGNTCFFNSVIQSLASLGPFTKYLARLRKAAELYDVPTPVGDALLDLLTSLNTPASRRSVIRPSALTDALSIATQGSSIRSLMTAHQQQDAHELLVLLLDALSKERTALLKEVAMVDSECQGSGLATILGKSIGASVQQMPEARRNLANPFEALVAQRTACLRCGYYDVIRNYVSEELSVNVPLQRRGGGGITIEDCLDSWAGLEGVEWRCWHCTLLVNLNKVEAEIQRLSSGSSSLPAVKGGSSTRGENACENGSGSVTHSGLVNGNGNGHQPLPSAKLTASAKKRLKEVRKSYSALSNALSKSLTEEEFRASHPSMRLVAPPLPAPTTSGSIITATKQTVFSRPPRTLAIHLNRSMYYGMGAGKNNTQVHLGEYLDLREWCIREGVEADAIKGMNEIQQEGINGQGDDNKSGWAKVGTNGKVATSTQKPPIWMSSAVDSEDLSGATQASGQHSSDYPEAEMDSPGTIYKLDSIVVHYGGHSFGHYVSFRRRPRNRSTSATSGQAAGQEGDVGEADEAGEEEEEEEDEDGWLRISDDSVVSVSLTEVLAQNAFLVFFHRMEPAGRKSQSNTSSPYVASDPIATRGPYDEATSNTNGTTTTTTNTTNTNPPPAPAPALAPPPPATSLAVAKALSQSRVPRARSLQRWELTDRLSVEPASSIVGADIREEEGGGRSEERVGIVQMIHQP